VEYPEWLSNIVPVPSSVPFGDQFPDEDVLEIGKKTWRVYFDGAANKKGCGIGVLLVSPEEAFTPLAIKLGFEAANNIAEYEACILALEAALELGIKELEVFGDSALIICLIKGEWKTRDEKLLPYHAYLEALTKEFSEIEFNYLLRNKNQFADALATLASMVEIPEGGNVRPLVIECRDKPVYCCAIQGGEVNDGHPWFHDIKKFIEEREYPEGASRVNRKTLRRLASHYVLCGGKLYRRSYDGIHLLYVTEEEAEHLIKEIHEGIGALHMNGYMLAKKIIRLGYYWSTMERDCHAHVKKCHKCQLFASGQHLPSMPLISMSSPWPFAVWGIDIIGQIKPKASNGHEYILVAIDYFTKWVEATSFKTLNAKKVAQFIQLNIIFRYGVPHEVISDNGHHFQKETHELLQRYSMVHHLSSPYRPQTNGAVEAANKNIKKILHKTAYSYIDWHEKLPLTLWGYRTLVRSSTGATPYSLVYGMEAMLPVELEVPSLRVAMESQITKVD